MVFLDPAAYSADPCLSSGSPGSTCNISDMTVPPETSRASKGLVKSSPPGWTEVAGRTSGTSRTAEMPLIFIDGIGQIEPSKRKQIRKYVMLGKNRGKTRHASSVQATVKTNAENVTEGSDGPESLSIKMRYSAIPNKVGSELSFTRFAATVEPSLIQDLLRFSFVAKKVMYPLESCIVFHRKTPIDKMWFEVLTYDAAYMHALVFSSQAYFLLTSGLESPTATHKAATHYSTTIQLLRERLSNQNQHSKISDPTIFIVLCLASHAHLANDYDSAKHHLEGLHKMVDMRGGLNALKYHSKLIIELLRCDLGIAVFNGAKPLFPGDSFLESLLPYDLASSGKKDADPLHCEPSWKLDGLSMNADLASIWRTTCKFCSMINSASKHNRRLSKETLLHSMASIMYRLIRMDHLEPTSTSEAIRLGLLAFSSHIFLGWRDIKLPHPHLPRTYRKCLLNLKLHDSLSPQLLLWLLMVGAISLFSAADDNWLVPWLGVNIDLCGVHDWEELHHQLGDLPWVNTLHDEPGKGLFDSAVSSRKEENVTW